MNKKTWFAASLVVVSILGFSTPGFGGPFGYYPTHAEMDSILNDLGRRYPAIVTRGVLTPKTMENRDIWYVKISNSPDTDNKKPEALITGAQHSCEVIGPACIRLDMAYLCSNYGVDPEVTWLVDNRQIYFIPIMNPDGYLFIQSNISANRMWRKNRRRNHDGSYGVDLNRNLPYKWGYDNVNSSPNPSAMNYRGSAPASEPETKAIMDFINTRKIRTWQNHHSHRDVLVIPFGYDYRRSLGSDSIIYYTMCQEQQAQYGRFKKWGPSYIAYDGWSLNGGSEDWSWSDSATYRVYCIITELGSAIWESDAAAKITAEKMVGADMYMIQCAGFFPVLKKIDLIDDGPGCNNDGVLNPGERVKLIAEIHNKSVVDTTLNVRGELSSSYPHIGMIATQTEYGSIKPLQTFRNNTASPFEFTCGSQAAEGDWAKFNIRITWSMHSVDFEKTVACSLRIGRYVGISQDYLIPAVHNGLTISRAPDNRSISITVSMPPQYYTDGANHSIKMNVFSASGKEVRTIDHTLSAPVTSLVWDMKDNRGRALTGGVYFIRVRFRDFHAMQRFVVMP